MIPVSPVVEGYQDKEVVFARDQPQYLPLPALVLKEDGRPVVSRWRLSEEEKQRIEGGADILLTQMIFDGPYNPIRMEVSG